MTGLILKMRKGFWGWRGWSTQKKILGLFGLSLGAALPFGVWYFVRWIEFYGQPVSDLEKVADRVVPLESGWPWQDVNLDPRQKRLIYLTTPLILALKAGDKDSNPQVLVQLYFQVSRDEDWEFFRQNEGPWRQIVTEVTSQWSFERLESLEGKKAWLEEIKKQLQLKAPSLQQIWLHQFVLKP